MKTSEMTGPALDWAVAKCEGVNDGKDFAWYYDRRDTYRFSSNWAQGGLIIERERISIIDEIVNFRAAMCNAGGECIGRGVGPTPLIAAMRCYVASCLGDEIDIPNELKEEV